jgi:MauM/NapG family ferredoxin protein
VPVVTLILALARRRGLLVAGRMFFQAAFLMLFLALLTQTVAPLDGYRALAGKFPTDFFLTLSPLIGISVIFIAGLTAATVVELVFAAVTGRLFCGWVCPLGTTFDIFDRIFLSRLDRPQARDAFLRGAKYVLLAAILVATIFGAQVAGWFDPMSVVTRSYAVFALPAADDIARGVLEKPLEHPAVRGRAAIAQPLVTASSGLKDLNLMYDARRYYMQFGAIAFVFAALLTLQFYQKRFWCRKLCPLGALLGVVGKWRPFGVYLDGAKCIDCGKCRKICPVGAIQGKGLSPLECTFCGSCVAPCPVDALKVRTSRPANTAAAPAVLSGRREFLLAAASGFAIAPILALDPTRAAGQSRLIRPPGAQDEERFLAACVRCGQCMQACPLNALHPSGFEAGYSGFWSPRIVPVLGHCDYNCLGDDQPVGNFCATVCPTGAIKKLTPKEKHDTPLGTACFLTDKCIPYAERQTCGVCIEHCPVPDKALKNEIVDVVDPATGTTRQIQRPYVDKTLCIGCGQCEHVCPLRGEKGIRVERRRSVT